MIAIAAGADRKRFVGIFIIALAVLAYQVLLTRIFSVTLYYHFAFAGISLAMLGMTVGAEKVYLKPARFSPDRFEQEWAKAALGFAISSVVLVLGFLYMPLVIWPALVTTVLSCCLLLFVIPFTYGGICVTMILTQSASVGKLYAADLIGASLGCIGVVLLLFYLDPVSVILLLATLSAYAAWNMAKGMNAATASKARGIMIILLAAAVTQSTLYLTDHRHVGIIWAKGQREPGVLFERWNAFSRVRVVPNYDTAPFGWGFGHPQKGPIEQKYLDIDAGAGTMLSHYTGDLKPFAFLANDVINMGYHIRPVRSVAVIGVGGGRDVMSALYFGATRIFAMEINPAIIEAVKYKFADFLGHIAELPQVTLINAEARSWLAQHHPAVDLVQISLIDTWAATAAGGLTLSENRLYTMEAWKEFLHTLTPQGMLVVSRWYVKGVYEGEFYRLLSLAADSLEATGVPKNEAAQHILAFNANDIVTVAISPSPFSPAEIAKATQAAEVQGFKLLAAPGFAVNDTSRIIASGQATQEFYDSLPVNVTSPTDNRPFFFYMVRLKDSLHARVMTMFDATNNAALSIVVILLLGTLIVTIGFIIQPLVNVFGKTPLKGVIADLVYFAGIGLGFMLIEISQMERLMIFLGHPVYGLSVVLFTLLLFGGIGSATVNPDVRPERLWGRPLLLCMVLAVIGWVMPALSSGPLIALGTGMRIFISVALLAPAGLCMGMMFPVGMILSARHRELQPWFWGINGAVSVFASILGVAMSMQTGIASAYWTGVGAYILCLCLVLRKRHRAA